MPITRKKPAHSRIVVVDLDTKREVKRPPDKIVRLLLETQSIKVTAETLGISPKSLSQRLNSARNRSWWRAIKKRWKSKNRAAVVMRWRYKKLALEAIETTPPDKRRLLPDGVQAIIALLLADGHFDPWTE